MQGGKSIHIYDDENSRLPKFKRKSVEITRQKEHRRPLGDICNILSTDKERAERDQEKKILQKEESEFRNESKSVGISIVDNNLQGEITRSISNYSLERTLDLLKRENEVALKERLYDLTEYVDDIYAYLRNLEAMNLISGKHLEGLDMTEKMRAILVDWMVEVHSHFSLCQETLELSIFILDRYTDMKHNLSKRNAQLVGLVSLFLAAKYEETEPLEICDILFVSDSALSEKEIIRAECVILKALDYNLSRPLLVQFVRRYSKIAGVTPMEHAYAMYFCDASLLEYSLVSVRPSLLAAAALFLGLCISKNVIDTKLWDEKLVNHSSYRLTDFFHLLPRISKAVQLCSKGKLEAVKKKHSNAERYCVSIMPGVQPATEGSIIQHFCQ